MARILLKLLDKVCIVKSYLWKFVSCNYDFTDMRYAWLTFGRITICMIIMFIDLYWIPFTDQFINLRTNLLSNTLIFWGWGWNLYQMVKNLVMWICKIKNFHLILAPLFSANSSYTGRVTVVCIAISPWKMFFFYSAVLPMKSFIWHSYTSCVTTAVHVYIYYKCNIQYSFDKYWNWRWITWSFQNIIYI